MTVFVDLALKHTRLKTKAAAKVLHGQVATDHISVFLATTAKVRRTLRKAARVNRGTLEEFSPLSSFGLNIMSRVSGHDAGQSSQANGNSRCEMNHD